jgi:hypothetical protein
MHASLGLQLKRTVVKSTLAKSGRSPGAPKVAGLFRILQWLTISNQPEQRDRILWDNPVWAILENSVQSKAQMS